MSALLAPLRPLAAIALASGAEVSRQPVHGCVVLGTLLAYALSPAVAMFSFGEDLSLLKDFGVSTLLLSCMVLVAVGVAQAVGGELESRTAHTLLSKPVSRWTVLAGKLVGVLAAALRAAYLYTLALCLAARIRPPAQAQEAIDVPAVTAALVAFVTAVLYGSWKSLQSPAEFGRASLRAAGFSFTLVLLIPLSFAADGSFELSVGWIDPLVLKGCLLAFLGVVPLAGAAVLLAVVLGRAALLGTLVVFVLGLALGRHSTLAWFLPDLQLFWVGEVFYQAAGHLPWSYLLAASLYALAYALAQLSLAAVILERVEV